MPFVGNKGTKVYHKKRTRGDACRVEEILAKNRKEFANEEEAKALKFRPCKICVRVE